MACCTARCTLVSICIFQLVFVLERTVFDALGYMYGLIIADGIQIIMIIVGIIGTYSYKPKYLVPYGTMQFLWIGWNAYLLCYYFEIGFLHRKQMWAYPMTLSLESSKDYFDHKLFTCNTSSITRNDVSNDDVFSASKMGYRVADNVNPNSRPLWMIMMTTSDPNCVCRPIWIKFAQCALQVIFSFFAMLYVCYIVYGYEEDDDCFDFIGGFDNYNPGYPEPTAPYSSSATAMPKQYHTSSSHNVAMGGGGGGGAHYQPNNMIMQPLPGMHHQMMDSRGNVYADSRA